MVNEEYLSDDEKEAVGIINDYLMNSDSQSIATKYGFNANDDYKSSAQFTGSEVNKALEMYKSNKDNVTIEVPIAKFDMNQKAYFQGGINGLTANGSTASYDAVVVAMNMIEEAKKSNPEAKAMIFLLSDGFQNVGYGLGAITPALEESKIPVYTISYTADADTDAMRKLSEVNEAATINADSEDIVYKIKSLFNSQM